MKLLDLKYLLVKNDAGEVDGFCSFMPTYEDDIAVIYCYEIHLSDSLQGFVFSFLSLFVSSFTCVEFHHRKMNFSMYLSDKNLEPA